MKPENPSAFPFVLPDGGGENGMSLRDWYAGMAPHPREEDIATQHGLDRASNPHNDSYKPRPRSRAAIIAALRYQFADAMLAARATLAPDNGKPADRGEG